MALVAALRPASRARIDAAIAGPITPGYWGFTLTLTNDPSDTAHTILRRRDGAITPAGRYYLQRLAERVGPRGRGEHLEFFPTDARREFRNGAEYMEDRDGNMRLARRWDPTRNGGEHRFTARGRQWGHSSVRYEVMVPAIGHAYRDGRWHRFAHLANGEPIRVPVKSDTIGVLALPADLRRKSYGERLFPALRRSQSVSGRSLSGETEDDYEDLGDDDELASDDDDAPIGGRGVALPGSVKPCVIACFFV